MSSDIYIPLRIVLSHPGQFELKAALNGDMQYARDLIKSEDNDHGVDWADLELALQPLLMCKFGARDSWRPVEVFDHDLHISCGGQFRDWLVHWLNDHAHKHTIIY